MNKQNVFHSSTHGLAISLLKERALHEYRDQERQAQRDVAVIELSEGRRHHFWRREPFPQLKAPSRAVRVLEAWREPVTQHGSPPITVVDVTKRDLGQRALRA
jgi:hypothetical protein